MCQRASAVPGLLMRAMWLVWSAGFAAACEACLLLVGSGSVARAWSADRVLQAVVVTSWSGAEKSRGRVEGTRGKVDCLFAELAPALLAIGGLLWSLRLARILSSSS